MGALIIRIGFRGPLYYNYNKEPTIGRPYVRVLALGPRVEFGAQDLEWIYFALFVFI